MNLKVLVVGAGAVGGYFGARLAAAGRDVTFLVRPRRADQLRRYGLKIVSPHGDLTINPNLIDKDDIHQPYDAILLSVKAYGLESAMDDFAPAVGEHTMILPVLNGTQHIERLVERFGDRAVLGGACRVVAELNDMGHIIQKAEVQSISYGERDRSSSDRIRSLDATMKGAGFATDLSSNIVQTMWDKWANLASLGAITCLFGGSVGKVNSVTDGAQLASALIEETVAVTRACGFPQSEEEIARIRNALTNPESTLTSSMFRGMRSEAPVESEQILGELVKKGQERGVRVPLLTAAAVSLRVFEAERVLENASSGG